MIFDIKLGDHFRIKDLLVGGGHMTTSPPSIAFLLVVARDSVRIAFTIAALNELDILACDIQNVYLTSLFREKIWTFVGPEFGEEEGTLMLVKVSLYGLKSSGAAFLPKLSGVLRDIGYLSTKGDPDVWIQPAVKPDGTEYQKWYYVMLTTYWKYRKHQ